MDFTRIRLFVRSTRFIMRVRVASAVSLISSRREVVGFVGIGDLLGHFMILEPGNSFFTTDIVLVFEASWASWVSKIALTPKAPWFSVSNAAPLWF